MERKNMVLLTVIAVATLLVAVVGATFAYFTATVTDSRDSGEKGDGTANITAGSVANTTVVGNVESGAGKFTATGVYPGHKEVAGLSVTVTNDEHQEGTTNTKVNIVYDVTKNGFQADEIEVSVYKKTGSEPVGMTEDYFGCTHSEESQGLPNEVHFSETCKKEISSLVSDLSLEKLGTVTKLKGNAESNLVLATDTITAEGQSAEETVYYYVVVEFKETGSSQNTSMNAELTGKISVQVA